MLRSPVNIISSLYFLNELGLDLVRLGKTDYFYCVLEAVYTCYLL